MPAPSYRHAMRIGAPLTAAQQRARLSAAWPQIACDRVARGGRLVCRGTLRPTPAARAYRVRLEYAVGLAPECIVESPALELRADQPAIPHTYPATDRLPVRPCLYFPRDGDWSADKPLALTVVPWLLAWLVFYEVWFVTGVWLGGGVAHVRPTVVGGLA